MLVCFSQLFPGAFLGARSGRGSGAKNRLFPISRQATVLIMYAYHLGEKASRRTACADANVAQGSKVKFGERGFHDNRRQHRDFQPP